jgi:hypothetical protein
VVFRGIELLLFSGTKEDFGGTVGFFNKGRAVVEAFCGLAGGGREGKGFDGGEGLEGGGGTGDNDLVSGGAEGGTGDIGVGEVEGGRGEEERGDIGVGEGVEAGEDTGVGELGGAEATGTTLNGAAVRGVDGGGGATGSRGKGLEGEDLEWCGILEAEALSNRAEEGGGGRGLDFESGDGREGRGLA